MKRFIYFAIAICFLVGIPAGVAKIIEIPSEAIGGMIIQKTAGAGGGDGFVGLNTSCTSNITMEGEASSGGDAGFITVTASASGTISYMHLSVDSGLGDSNNTRMIIYNADYSFLRQTACFNGSAGGQIDVALESSAEITNGNTYHLVVCSADSYWICDGTSGGVSTDYDQSLITIGAVCPDDCSSTTLAKDGDWSSNSICIWADNSAS